MCYNSILSGKTPKASFKALLFSFLFILAAGMVFSMGIGEVQSQDQSQSQNQSQGSSQPCEDIRVVPKSSSDLYFSFSGITEKVLPVVVEIDTVEVIKQQTYNFFNPFDFFFGNNNPGKSMEREYKQSGLGSGIIIQQDKNTVYVLTNSHVAGKAEEITIKLYDGRKFNAKKMGNDSRMDLALISFETNEKVPVAVFGDSDELEVGDIVLAVGTPYGFESTVTAGIVSGLGRKNNAMTRGQVSDFTDYIQTDASINPGNSGGALVNMKGEVIGINTWIATQTGGNVGLGFAIPSNSAKRIVSDFINKGKVEYGWLGVTIDDADENRYKDIRKDMGLGNRTGAMVLGVFKKSPAEKSGIFPGDFIVKVNDTVIKNASHLTKTIGVIPPKERTSFTVIRNKKEKILNVVLDVRDEEEKIQSNSDIWPGIFVMNINDDIRKEMELGSKVRGVAVINVHQGTAAEKANFRTGDIIENINDIPIANIGDFYTALNDERSSKKMFQIIRGGQTIIIGLVK